MSHVSESLELSTQKPWFGEELGSFVGPQWGDRGKTDMGRQSILPFSFPLSTSISLHPSIFPFFGNNTVSLPTLAAPSVGHSY